MTAFLYIIVFVFGMVAGVALSTVIWPYPFDSEPDPLRDAFDAAWVKHMDCRSVGMVPTFRASDDWGRQEGTGTEVKSEAP